MAGVIGIRQETKSHWERRIPLTPGAIQRLTGSGDVHVLVQPCPRRIVTEAELRHAGAELTDDLSRASVIFGVKEVPPELLLPRKAYMFFSHVIKGQSYNMEMLSRLLELECTLIDYEKVCNAEGQRLIFFGRFAGLAGMIDALWSLGQRLATEGIATPFDSLQPAHAYSRLDEAKCAIRAAGQRIASDGLPAQLSPFIVGVTGYGNVAAGVQDILSELPTIEIGPDQVAGLAADPGASRRALYRVTYREQDIVEPINGTVTFDRQDYYDHPERYRSCFGGHLPHLGMLINCNYWDERYPRLVPSAELERLFASGRQPRLRIIGDLACDIEGSVECTVRATEPGDPTYVYDPLEHKAIAGFEGRGPVVLAVDILPTELPLDASAEFSKALEPFVPAMAAADLSADLNRLDLPPEIRRAIITHKGRLTPEYEYLQAFLKAS